ncbi:MAG: N-6 DNA methylase [Dehalococcoidia bacterium]
MQNYLSAVRRAKDQGASHDYLRSIFIDFAKESFSVDPKHVELEKGIKGATLRGRIDALYQDIVFEFKRDLRIERDKGKEELERYLRSLGNKQIFFGVLTDGLVFEAYLLQDDSLKKIDEVNLEKLLPEDAFIWFDAFIFSESERKVTPTSQDVVKRFGDTSPVFNSSFRRLSRMLASAKQDPSCQVKFNEWDKLLAKAYGHSVARNQLFLRHTYLSVLVKLLAYATLFKKQPKGQQLTEIINGRAFTNLLNLAEEDFFCWVLVPSLEKEALELLRGLERHLMIYDLTKIDVDLLKELYENLVDRETKHDLGEVYTPDWLVEVTLREAGFSKGKRLLDPACGSGTFLFTAIQLLREQGLQGVSLVDEALQNIVGVDVHPLAVTISKVNYVLALAPDLSDYGKTVILPVYMADSLQAVEPTGGERVSIRAEGEQFFNIPRYMSADPASLDETIDAMRRYVSGPEDMALDGFSAYLEAQGHKDFVYLWRPNLRLMRKLVHQGRDTIWAFILKNYYRPAYLHQHPFDIVAGNPPWLSYRYITDSGYQKQVKQLVFSYELLTWKEVNLFTHMEIATLFFALASDAYLRKGGTIAFVMPRSVLTGAKQHQRFQELIRGYKVPTIALEKVLDAEEISPLFNVPACVLIARKARQGKQVTRVGIRGALSRKNLCWREAKGELKLTRKQVAVDKIFMPVPSSSPYLKNMKEGATLVPRCFWFVQPVASAYGINQAKPAVETHPEAQKTAKKPWQNIYLKGEVESQYLYASILGRQLLPFGCTELSLVVLPIEHKPTMLIEGEQQLIIVRKEMALGKGHFGLYEWLNNVEALWVGGRKERSPENIYSRLDYQHLLTCQRPTGYHTVVYNRAGTNLASCVISPSLTKTALPVQGFTADADTYYYQTKNAMEAHYLCAFLNAPYVDGAIKPHQTRGQWGERDIHRRPFEYVPIPKFNPEDEKHGKLAELSQACHEKVKKLKTEGKSIGNSRGKVRKALANELADIDELVREILEDGPSVASRKEEISGEFLGHHPN